MIPAERGCVMQRAAHVVDVASSLSGEPGELVGRIDKGDPIRHFTGYVDDTETDNKIASNVFSKGDKAFLSGETRAHWKQAEA